MQLKGVSADTLLFFLYMQNHGAAGNINHEKHSGEALRLGADSPQGAKKGGTFLKDHAD